MPKTSGAVLDWVPQKAAQQMHSDAMTRFMPKSRVAFPLWCSATPGRRRKSAHIFDPFARGSQVRADWRDQPATAHARRTSASMAGLMGDRPQGRAVTWASSLRCDQLFRDLARLLPGGFRCPAHVPGAEQELLHLDMVCDCGEIVPRLDEGVAEHGALHQPEAERQDQLAAEAGWKLAVHDDDASARAQLRPCVGVVAKPE